MNILAMNFLSLKTVYTYISLHNTMIQLCIWLGSHIICCKYFCSQKRFYTVCFSRYKHARRVAHKISFETQDLQLRLKYKKVYARYQGGQTISKSNCDVRFQNFQFLTILCLEIWCPTRFCLYFGSINCSEMGWYMSQSPKLKCS